MKVLVLGATGMLGHKLLQSLSLGHDVWRTIRNKSDQAIPIPGIERDRLIGEVSASALPMIRQAVKEIRPDVVLNCIGIVKQIDSAKNAITSMARGISVGSIVI